MKKFLLTLSILSLGVLSCFADEFVNGYLRDSDGDGVKDTYVSPHWRSNPDGNVWNNWSTKGNINPYTGEMGHRNPYGNENSIGGSYHRKRW